MPCHVGFPGHRQITKVFGSDAALKRIESCYRIDVDIENWGTALSQVH